jgi:hemerythrin
MTSKNKAILKVSKKELVKEHKRIVPMLKKAGLKKEAKEQAEELKEIKKK